ncbi:uncharacterized protein LOC117345064 isoform X2 [Pecten maximus]|uniref:uncharacterized protein LOC117345064 isoform X2 n=1 Tax=Pecten maximus TaxID=6579 RepID=UPI00145903D3|nr:uncharacterized protein LOC117345064 isoform X2 [Pecten maximus]
MASLLYRFEVVSHSNDDLLLQRGLVCLVLTADINMVVHCKDNMIKATLFSEKQLKSAQRQAIQIRTVFKHLLESTLQRNDQGHLKYSEHLERDFEISTEEAASITTRAEKEFWFGDLKVSRRKRDDSHEVTRRKQAEVSSSHAQEGLTLKQFSRIARHISASSYQIFFIELGMEAKTIDQVRHENRGLDVRSWMTRMLIRWRNDPDTAEEATLGCIVDAMNAISLETADMISDLAPKPIYEEETKVAELVQRSKVPLRCLVEAEIPEVARLIGKMYVVFFIELDLSNESIEEAEVNYTGNVLKMKEQLLSEWLSQETDGAYVVRLVMAFKELRQLDSRALIDVLKKTPA